MTHRVLHETKVGGKQARPGDLVAPSQRELTAAPWCFEELDKDAEASTAPPPSDLFERLREQDRAREAQEGSNREATRRRLALQHFQQGLGALGHGREQLQEHAEQLVVMAMAAIESDRREREERAEYERLLAAEQVERAARQAEADRMEAERAFVPPGEEGLGTVDVVVDPPKPERRGRRGAAQE